MNKILFSRVLSIVCNLCDVTEEEILSSLHRSDVVDARALLSYVLYRKGVYPNTIAKYMNKSGACVRRLISNYDARKRSNKLLATIENEIEKQLETK